MLHNQIQVKNLMASKIANQARCSTEMYSKSPRQIEFGHLTTWTWDTATSWTWKFGRQHTSSAFQRKKCEPTSQRNNFDKMILTKHLRTLLWSGRAEQWYTKFPLTQKIAIKKCRWINAKMIMDSVGDAKRYRSNDGDPLQKIRFKAPDRTYEKGRHIDNKDDA